jgi:hypothetical protein
MSSTPPPEPRHVLESRVRLSESLLWELQRRFFTGLGPAAWTRGGVPWWITTNASMALAYARVVLAYFKACIAEGLLTNGEPLHVIELGAGHGRLSRLVFLRLQELMEAEGIPLDSVRYVFTDVAESNVDAFASHAYNRSAIEAGHLDCAVFDAENPGELHLRHSGVVLGASEGPRPLAVIANYVIDSIRMDVFRVEHGELFEGLLTLSSPQPEPDPTDPSILERLAATYDYEPVVPERYDDCDLVEILEEYADRLADTTFTFPVAAFDTLRELERIGGGNLLVLAADKGFGSEQELLHSVEPAPVVHGSFSLSANFHAIGQWVVRRGGAARHTAPRDASLRISAFVVGLRDRRAVLAAFDQHIDRFGPLDSYAVHEELLRSNATPGIGALLALVRMSDYDPRLFWFLCHRFVAQTAETGAAQRQAIREAAHRVWERYLPYPGESDDLAFALGHLLGALRFFDDALRFYELSIELFGEDHATRYNMALIHHELRDLPAAEVHLAKSLALDPGYAPARGLRLRLEEDMGRPTPGISDPQDEALQTRALVEPSA